MSVHLVRGVLPDWYEPNGDWIASLDEDAVNHAVLTWTRCDSDTTLIGFDNSALHEDVSSNVVWIRFILNDVVNGSEGGLSRATCSGGENRGTVGDAATENFVQTVDAGDATVSGVNACRLHGTMQKEKPRVDEVFGRNGRFGR